MAMVNWKWQPCPFNFRRVGVDSSKGLALISPFGQRRFPLDLSFRIQTPPHNSALIFHPSASTRYWLRRRESLRLAGRDAGGEDHLAHSPFLHDTF